jgi:hypothetical protein
MPVFKQSALGMNAWMGLRLSFLCFQQEKKKQHSSSRRVQKQEEDRGSRKRKSKSAEGEETGAVGGDRASSSRHKSRGDLSSNPDGDCRIIGIVIRNCRTQVTSWRGGEGGDAIAWGETREWGCRQANGESGKGGDGLNFM